LDEIEKMAGLPEGWWEKKSDTESRHASEIYSKNRTIRRLNGELRKASNDNHDLREEIAELSRTNYVANQDCNARMSSLEKQFGKKEVENAKLKSKIQCLEFERRSFGAGLSSRETSSNSLAEMGRRSPDFTRNTSGAGFSSREASSNSIAEMSQKSPRKTSF